MIACLKSDGSRRLVALQCRRLILFLLMMAISLSLGHYAQAEEKDKPSLSEAIETHRNFFQAEVKDGILKDAEPRVRIALRLTPFKTLQGEGMGRSQVTAVPEPTLRYTLRAKLSKPNHFYFHQFHVQTIPLSWRKESHVYKVKLLVNRRFDRGVEESLGALELRGLLQGEKNIYTLEGLSSHTFRDKWGEPVLQVVAGFPGPRESAEIKIAKPSFP